jgi:hypothetical protein
MFESILHAWPPGRFARLEKPLSASALMIHSFLRKDVVCFSGSTEVITGLGLLCALHNCHSFCDPLILPCEQEVATLGDEETVWTIDHGGNGLRPSFLRFWTR